MSSVRSQVIQLPSSNDQVLIINPDGTVVQESNQVYYKKPNAFKRAYEKYKKPKNHYIIEQEGLSYRYCECCHRWCTRRCPACDFCDRIFACPLYFCVIAGLLLLGLLIALLTLFGLLPGVNPSQRYYGIIHSLSIINKTTYILGLDTKCIKYGVVNNCLDLTTAQTVVQNIATTIITNNGNRNYLMKSKLISIIHLSTIFCFTFILKDYGRTLAFVIN